MNPINPASPILESRLPGLKARLGQFLSEGEETGCTPLFTSIEKSESDTGPLLVPVNNATHTGRHIDLLTKGATEMIQDWSD